jgi:hypothetical protein
MSGQINMNNSNNPAHPPIDSSTPMDKWSSPHILFQQTKGDQRLSNFMPRTPANLG